MLLLHHGANGVSGHLIIVSPRHIDIRPRLAYSVPFFLYYEIIHRWCMIMPCVTAEDPEATLTSATCTVTLGSMMEPPYWRVIPYCRDMSLGLWIQPG
ncbi:hypothetical protein HDV64DRAFT_246853 [Trichoderma sp. TUCIM 5745]